MKTRTKGLNPNVTSSDLLESRLANNVDILAVRNQVTEFYFYGAGCSEQRAIKEISEVFHSFFSNAKIEVKEDTYAAVYAVAKTPSIVCILGTGSNACYFDGKSIDVRVPSLGYILMDEASGNYFGKKLIQDYFYHKMPVQERSAFENMFEVTSGKINENVYSKENPNRYLASFAPFLFGFKDSSYCQQLLYDGINKFFENKVLAFSESKSVPIHFVGSIAYYASDTIKQVADSYSLELGKTLQKPIEGLIRYHREKINS
jgi:N-acetylglucosamine kinase-like BadF-type ATPase